MIKLTVCDSCKVELSKIGLSPDKNSCKCCGNNPDYNIPLEAQGEERRIQDLLEMI